MRAEDEIDSDEPVIIESGYYASYVIGAQWFDEEKTMPLVVTTKYGCDRIDFLKMFSVCFNSGIEAKEFSKIYAVDMEQPRIKAPELKSVLSPLIVAHFLSIVNEIVKRGLKKTMSNERTTSKRSKAVLPSSAMNAPTFRRNDTIRFSANTRSIRRTPLRTD